MMLQSRERIPVVLMEDHESMARALAERIARIIRERNAQGAHAVLGLATGSTPIGVYRELIRLHREEGLDFSRVVTFNLDEYYPMDPESHNSYVRFMWENLFSALEIPPGERPHPRWHHSPGRAGALLPGLRRSHPSRGRHRLHAPGHRPERPHRLQRAGIAP